MSRLGVAVFIHGLIVGLLIGLTENPIVSTVLPLLLGAGLGLGAFLSLAGTPSRRLVTLLEQLFTSWLPALWLSSVLLSLVLGIYCRTKSQQPVYHTVDKLVGQIASDSLLGVRVATAYELSLLGLSRNTESVLGSRIAHLSETDLLEFRKAIQDALEQKTKNPLIPAGITVTHGSNDPHEE